MTFSEYLQTQATSRRELPLVHATECHHFDSIRRSHMLRPRPCPVFNEPLLYFFYGRPSYRDSSKTTPIKDISYCPICFVFRTGRNIPIKRLFPFDTGASQNPHALYEPQVLANDALLKFSLIGAIQNAQRIVRTFFDTDENYLGGRAKIGLAFSRGELDAKAYYDLISGGGKPECDDRRSAIEIQTDASIDLHGALLAIAMPTTFLEDAPLMQTLLEDWHALPLTYSADIGMRPTEFHGTIRELIRIHYKAWNLI
jgi:hypothetical protein